MWTLDVTEKEWFVSNRYYPELDESKLGSIFYFSLIWNIYEKELCQNVASIQKHPTDHSQRYSGKVDENILAGVFDYFKNRYVLAGEETDLYRTFNFRETIIKKEIIDKQ